MFKYPWITAKTAVFQSENHSRPQCGLRFSDQVQNRKFAVAVLVIRGYLWFCRSLPRTQRPIPTKRLDESQEAALIRWIETLDALHVPPTARMMEASANAIIQRDAEAAGGSAYSLPRSCRRSNAMRPLGSHPSCGIGPPARGLSGSHPARSQDTAAMMSA